ncbi:hypothetical protein [Burkholderia gladioli]|uniref:hypothetical protein n=1 Tax=Burkholderia gladioli TaxID=28095 RepID=UPI0016420D01|nr:hypothetical protein [Burkholderia gladioli]
MSDAKRVPMPKMVERKCERCRAPLQAREADVKRGWGRFCSKSCKANKQAASRRSSRGDHDGMQKWEREEVQFESDMYSATSGWDEGGWLSDDSGVTKI